MSASMRRPPPILTSTEDLGVLREIAVRESPIPISALAGAAGSGGMATRKSRVAFDASVADAADKDDWSVHSGESADQGALDEATLRTYRALGQRLNDMVEGKPRPKVHVYPAPVEAPSHTQKIPMSLYAMHQHKEGACDRLVQSTLGRLLTYALTLVTFGWAAFALVEFQDSVLLMHGEHYPMMLGAIFAIVFLFVFLPILAQKAGINPSLTGWKPYLVIYHCSYLLALPALICFYLGLGHQSAFGLAAGRAGEVSMGALVPGSGRYFEASDGYVALNLTKGVLETFERTEHGDQKKRISRFRNAELVINKEPFSDQVEPTVPPGTTQLYVIAPIFGEWAPCATKYRISTTCLGNNAPVGWAFVKLQSMCNGLNMVACRASLPELSPIYKCSTTQLQGRLEKGAVVGLCGRVVLPPPESVVDELAAIYLSEQWPLASLPNSTQVWVDVHQDPCIGQPASCVEQWELIAYVGNGFAILVVLCILVPAAMDWTVDRRIREARKYWHEQQGLLGATAV